MVQTLAEFFSETFQSIKAFWREHGFETTVILAILTIAIIAYFRKGKKGTWSTSLVSPIGGSSRSVGRKPPQESRGEIECRRVLESIFSKPFPKSRPDLLRNPVTGGEYNLELDCYNPELKIACEYNGVQHYKYVPYFHKNQDAFQNQKYRDYMKKEMCAKNGIFLIEIPYTVKDKDIESHIRKELEKRV